ncbi:MAG TPA: DUF1801 domain-containing protein [Bacteroidales bacterium]|jgi:hypothetical protein|nr:DUF1801 domain-containing protein [Bacteroidales bacterium]
MSEIKTKPTGSDIEKFLSNVEPEKRRKDSFELKKLFDSVVQEQAALWNNNMIGYGNFHYKSERSRQEGDWPLTAFSPRKQYLAVYIMSGVNSYKELLSQLGKYKVSSGSCIYINKIEDVNLEILKKIVSSSVADMKKIHKIN